MHGIEPRAWVFALSQCGDPSRASAALDAALRDFVSHTRSLALAQWPLQFWTSLLSQPTMLASFESDSPLAHIAPGPRAALLLRLIVGLDFDHAAQVLQVSQAAYELALRKALDHPEMDDARMQGLREDLHEQIHGLTDGQRQALAEMREGALSMLADERAPAAAPTWRFGRKRWWLGAVAALAVLVLVITLYQPVRSLIAPGKTEALPEENIAPPPELSDAVIVTHPDYEQLAHPEDDAIARQLAFLSWMAATSSPAGPIQTAADTGSTIEAFEDLPAAEQVLLSSARSAWPTLDPETRTALLRNARHWQSGTPAQHAQLRQRLLAWDRQSAPSRARRRAPFVAWQRLGDADQKRVRDSASKLSAMPAVEQQDLRAQFGALPSDIQNLWLMGPSLGEELVPLASLFAFMPEDERPALLAAVHALDAQSRADLAVLAPRLSEARRQALRQDLLAAPAGQRAELIRQRLAQ